METTVARKTQVHIAPYEIVMNSTIMSMLGKARNQLKLAREANSSRDTRMENEQKNKLITTIMALRDITLSTHINERPEDISGLFSYMIDRLSIRYSIREIHPLTEVWWLLDSLKNVLERPETYRKH